MLLTEIIPTIISKNIPPIRLKIHFQYISTYTIENPFPVHRKLGDALPISLSHN